MKSWGTISLISHIITFVVLFVLLWHYDFVKASSTVPGFVFAIFGQQIPVSRIDEAIKNPDALQIAYNVGVLEVLSLALTLFAIIIAVAAAIGFWMIRGAAINAADEAARAEIKQLVPKLAQSWFEDEGRKIFETAAKVNGGATTASIGLGETNVQEVIKDAKEIKDL